MLATSDYARYVAQIQLPAYLLCILMFLFRIIAQPRNSTRKIIGLSVGMVLAVIASITAKVISFGMSIIVIVACNNIRIEKVFKVTFVTTIICAIIIIFSSQLGIIEDYVYKTETRVRHALGFRYVLFLPTYFFNLCAIYVYLTKDRVKVSILVGLFAVNYLLYTITVSRLTFYSTAMLLLFAVYNKWVCRFKRKRGLRRQKLMKIWALLVPVYIICAAASLYMILIYDSSVPWHNTLNSLLGGRLDISQRSLRTYAFSALGNSSIVWIGQGRSVTGELLSETEMVNYVDNLYFNILQRFGAIFLGIVLILLTVMMYKSYKHGDKVLMFILAMLAVHGLIDDLVQYAWYNSFLFMTYYLVFNRFRKSHVNEKNARSGSKGKRRTRPMPALAVKG